MLNLLFGPRPKLVDEGRRLFDSGATLLDVRSPEEFASGHVQGACNIPVHTLSGRLHELGEKDKPIVVHCKSGGRSATARKILNKAGFAHVVDVGSMPRW